MKVTFTMGETVINLRGSKRGEPRTHLRTANARGTTARLCGALVPDVFTENWGTTITASETAHALLLELGDGASRANEIANAEISVWSESDLASLIPELEPVPRLLRAVFRNNRNPRLA